MQEIRRMFPGANTTSGFVSLHNNIISDDRNKLYILKGMPGGGKSSMMKDIAQTMYEKGYSIEYHHCPSDPSSIDGIVISELKIAIVDGTEPHIIDPIYPGITDKIIDLAVFIDMDNINGGVDNIQKARESKKSAYAKAYNYFKAAKVIFEGIEEENKTNINKHGLNKEVKKLMDSVFSDEEPDMESNKPTERHLFSNAYTPDGFVDHTDSLLTSNLSVYYLEGNCIGESYILDMVLNECRINGYEIDVFHNSLIPERLETINIKNLNKMITINKNIGNRSEIKIDFNKYLEKISNKDDFIMFDILVDQGVKSLKRARENHNILEKIYSPSIDFTKINKVKNNILEEIQSFVVE